MHIYIYIDLYIGTTWYNTHCQISRGGQARWKFVGGRSPHPPAFDQEHVDLCIVAQVTHELIRKLTSSAFYIDLILQLLNPSLGISQILALNDTTVIRDAEPSSAAEGGGV